ncbi:MAG TPA: beta-propeller domain-containing protein [Gaiellaceae bacterium]|jgi:uncharacterized secreted protein with C-terminal beta-propeller domain|nr:beta-propeller domain-containing protein [Gaiellaceae bacterium]
MWRRSSSLAVVAMLVALAAPTGALALKAPSAAAVRPHTFASCTALVAYAKGNLARTHGIPEQPISEPAVATSTVVPKAAASSTATPGVVGAAADSGTASGTAYSTTNDQEQGVDEPDIVKTDGSTIFAVSGNTLEAVSVAGGAPRIAGTLSLGSGAANAQLLLDGNRLLVITNQIPLRYPFPGPIAAASSAIKASPYVAWGATTQLSEVDVSDPSAMKVTQTLSVDGTFVDARLVGSSARLVISSAPHAILQPQLATGAPGWVPTWRFRNVRSGRHFTRQIAACGSIRRPVQFSGLGMLSIVTVDFAKGLGAAQSTSIMADAQIVYGSTASLYIATQQWLNPRLGIAQLPTGQSTVIDRFDVSDPDVTTFAGSGEVPGYLLNQFSLSEQGNYLRVASTSRPIWWGTVPGSTIPLSQSYVTVLDTSGGVLAPVGQVSGLGQGEQITSVRFIGNTGYVVTYRQVDPLYTIDLSTPTAPRVAGELDLAGYSAYLHPVGPGLLLGIGSDVSSTNEPDGTQLELFDVSDPANPKLLAKTLVGTGSSSQVTYDHHAFLYWPATNLAVLPIQIYGAVQSVTPGVAVSNGTFTGAIGYKVTSGGITEVGRAVQDAVNGQTPQIERSLVIGDSLFTISAQGVMASSLATLARQAFVAFPGS